MIEQGGVFYGSEESSTGLVRPRIYFNEIARHLTDPVAIAEAGKTVAEALSRCPSSQDFCLTSNEIGTRFEGMGHLELAAQCYEWAYGQSDSLENFRDPNVEVYGTNLVGVLQRISQQPELTEDAKEFLTGKKGIVKGIGKFFGHLKDYRIYQRAFTQLNQAGGVVWDGDENQAYIVGLQETEASANALANLL